MAVITWQNISAPSSRDVGRELDGAQRGLSGGFDKLAEILQQREAVNQGVADRARAAGAQDYLNTLQGFKTPEELQAARMNGTLDQALAKVDVRNQAEVRGAAEARIAGLQGQSTAANDFTNKLRTFQDQGVVQSIRADIGLGKHEAARATIAANPQLLNAGELTALASPANQLTYKNQQTAAKLTDTLSDTTDQTATVMAETAGKKAVLDAKVVKDAGIVDAALAPRLASFNQSNDAQMAQIREIGVKGGYPLDVNGLPDSSKMTPAQLETFATASKGLTPVTSSNHIASLKAELAKQGVSAMGIADAVTKAESLFKTKGALSADDAGRIAQRTGEIGAMVDEATRTNPFYTPPAQLSQAKTAVLTSINTMVKDGPMTVTRLREKVGNWMDKGMEMQRDGKTVNVPIPPKIIEQALAGGLETKSWFVNSSDNNMEALIKQAMTDPKNKQLMSQADWLYAQGHKVAARDFELSVRQQANTATPTDLMENFQRRLEAARSDASTAAPSQFQYALPLVANPVGKQAVVLTKPQSPNRK